MKYLALIGDIVASRNIDNREEVQERFKAACSRLNRRRKAYGIVSPLTITLGDEFQCVLDSADGLWPLLARLELEMYPVILRFSVGIGEISTSINLRSALGMDGPAFYRAREGMEKIKKGDSLYRITGLGLLEPVISSALDLHSAGRQKWNYNRLATFCYLQEEMPVPKIGKKLEVTEQSVYKTRRDGQLDTVMDLLREIRLIVNQVLHDD